MALARNTIMTRLVMALSVIVPPTYYSNVGGRVYRRLRDIGQIGPNEYPLLMVVEAGTYSAYRNDEQSMRTTLDVDIYGLVREDMSDLVNSTAAVAACNLHDDIVAALRRNDKLSNYIQAPILFRNHQMLAGVDDSAGLVVVGITIPWHFYEANLGPLAP